MNARFLVAQANGSSSPGGSNAPQIIKITKPQGNTTQVIHLDGTVTLDLSAIANEKITLVHLGNTLIILFDNQATVTLDPFYDGSGHPLTNLTVELGPGHDVSSAEFAQLFPVTDDQSILPAAGGTGTSGGAGNPPASGADFSITAILDALTNGTGLPLLGPSGPPGGNAPSNNFVFTTHSGSSFSLTSGTVHGTVNEGGLANGNHPAEVTTASGAAGSLDTLVSSSSTSTPSFQFVSASAASAWLASLGLTAHGAAIDTATINGNTLIASTDPNQADPHNVFSLTINANGSWTFTLLAPIDIGPNEHDSAATINLSGLIAATNGSGTTVTLANDFTITVTGDTPVLTGHTASGTAAETALADPPDTFGVGNGGGSTTVSGNLSTLVSFGAQGAASQTSGATTEAAGFQFTLASGATHDFGVASHGQEVNFVTIASNAAGPDGISQTLTAFTDGGLANGGHAVFTLTLNGDGTFTFTLLSPLDIGANEGDSAATLDLSSLIKAVDFGGDTVALAHDFQITVTDDVPQLNTAAIAVFSTVSEAGLSAATDSYGIGSQANFSPTMVGGVLPSDLVKFGADGPATPEFQFVNATSAANFLAAQDLVTHGFAINAVSINGNTLTALDSNGDKVFVLALSGNAFTFELLEPIENGANPHQSSLTVDLSGLVQALDFDGDAVTLANDFKVTVIEDTPVLTAATVVGTVNQSGLTSTAQGGTDSWGDGTQAGITAISTSDTVAGSLQTLAHSADGDTFQLVGATAAGNFLAAQNLTSHGFAIDAASISGNTLTALDSNNDKVFTLTVNSNGSWTFTLLEPLDDGPNQHENGTTIDLSGLVTASDFDGAQTTLSNDFKITVNDDSPTTVSGASLNGTVEEGPLESGDPNPTLQTVAGAAGALDALVNFGADGPGAFPTTNAAIEVDANQAADLAFLQAQGLTSNGAALAKVTVTLSANGNSELEAFDSNNNAMFDLLVHPNGSYTFELLEPIDAVPVNGSSTIDLSGLIEATDFDGGTTLLSPGTFTVTVDNDRPVANAVHASGDENTPNPPSTITPNAGPIAIELTATDNAAGATITSFTVTSLPTDGTLFLDAALTQPVTANTPIAASGNTLTLYFEPTAFFAGEATFQYTATDSNGATSPSAGTATIDVAPVADPPVITNVTQTEFSPTDPSPVAFSTLVTLAGGGFVESWQSNGEILAQVFSASGEPVGSQITVGPASPTGTPAFNLAVALTGGGFAIVWTNEVEVFAQAFNADGSPNGTTQVIESSPHFPDVAVQVNPTTDGGFVVLYERVDHFGQDTVHTEVFSANGTPSAAGPQLAAHPHGVFGDQVNIETNSFPTPEPQQLATLPNGYAIAFSADIHGQEVQEVRVYDNSGNPITPAMQVGTTPPPPGGFDAGFNDGPGGMITALADGDFAVTWERNVPGFPVGYTEVLTEVYHASNNYIGSPEVLVSTGANVNGAPAFEDVQQITALSTGGYVVMWQQTDFFGNEDTFVQVYDANGHLADTNPADANGIQVDTAATGAGNTTPEEVIALSGGAFAVMWGAGPNADDTFVRVFNADGSPVDDGVSLSNGTATANNAFFGVEMLKFADGSFAVIYDNSVTDGSGNVQDHLFAQHVGANGALLGAPIELVSSPFTGATPPEISNFDEFRDTLTSEGLIVSGGTTSDNSTNAINLGVADTAIGYENTPIALFFASIPPDPDETLKVTITGVPAGGSFEINGVMVGAAGSTPGTWVISDPAETALLANNRLEFVAPTAGTYTLNFDVQSNDTATLTTGPVTSTADTFATVTVNVVDVNDVTLSNPSSVSTLAGQAISLGIGAPVDADNGNDLTITVTAVPGYGTVLYTDANNIQHQVFDGTVLTTAELTSLTFFAPAGTPAASGDNLVYAVQDGPNSVLGTIAVNLVADADAPVITNVDSNFAFTPTADQVHDLHTIALSGGGYVATWGNSVANEDQVFAQVFDANNQPISLPFQVGPLAATFDTESNVVALAGGGFAMVWQDGASLKTEAFNANGGATGSGPVSVTDQDLTNNTDAQIVVALSNGDYAVVYGQHDPVGGPSGTDDVYARIYDATGTAVTGPIQANSFGINADLFENTSTPITRDISQVVATKDGFVVMWESTSDDGSGTPAEHTYVSVFNNNGSVASGPIEVNAPSGVNADEPGQVVALSGDDFAVMWQETVGGQQETLTRIFKASDNYAGTTEIVTGGGPVGTDDTPWQIVELANDGYAVVWNQIVGGVTSDVFAQVYDANGNLTGATPAGGIQVDSGAAVGLASADDVVALAGGGFVVEFDTLFGPDPSGDTFVQAFNAQGEPVGSQIQINTTNPNATFVTGVQTGVVALADGGFEAIWDQSVTTANGGQQDQIWAERFDANGNLVAGTTEELFATASNLSNQAELSIIDEFKTAFANGTILTGAISNDSGIDAGGNPFSNDTLTLDFAYTASGSENTPIALFQAFDPATSGEALTSITLSGFPAGSGFILNGSLVGGPGANNTWVITDPVALAALATESLTLVPPSGFSGEFTLTVEATDTKTLGAQTSTATATDNIDVTVTAVNDVTLSNPAAVTVSSGSGPVSLSIGAPVDPDLGLGQADIITIQAVPGYGTVQYFDGSTWQTAVDGTQLTAAELQSLQYVAPAGGSFHGDSVVYSVQDGASLVDGTIAVTVTDPAAGLYFSADATNNALNPDLFTLDSNGNLTSIPVSAPNGSSAGEDGGYIAFANELYFNANSGTLDGEEVLFRLGPDNVAHPVTDANGDPIAALSGISANFTIYDGSLYFVAEGSSGTDLFKIDPTGAVSELNVNPGGNAFDQFNDFGFTQFDGNLYFDAYNAGNTTFDTSGLYFISPAGALTQVLYQGSSLGDPGEDGGFFTFNGGLFFNAFDPITFQSELFVLDANGTPTPVEFGGSPMEHNFGETTYFAALGGDLYVTEQGSSTADALLQITPDGAVTEIQFDSTAGLQSFDFTIASERDLGGLATFNNNVYFSADTPATDAQPGVFFNPVLFQLSSAGVTSEVLFNGHPITDAGEDGGFVSFNNNLYFFADDPSSSTGAALFQMTSGGSISEVVDPTDPAEFIASPQSTTAHFTVFDGNLYFEAMTSEGDQLVEIDLSGNTHVIDINPSGNAFPGENGGFGVYTPIAEVFAGNGNTQLTGGANTVFITGNGNDSITAAGVNDTAVINANFGDPSTQVSLNNGTVTVTFQSGGNTYTDTLTGMDRIQFADKGLLIVDPNGDFGFSSVQAAVNAATAGDTIWVLPGTYTETDTPTPFSSTPGGLFINTPNLTLQGVEANGTPITSVTDANKNDLPLIISGAQTDFGSNFFVGPNADNTVIEGLHLQAGPETNNKLLEIWANNVTVQNDYLDVDIGGTPAGYSGAIAIYLNGNGSTFTHALGSYTIADNILNEGIDASNGVGIAGSVSPTDLIENNTFEGTFELSTGLGRYDTIVVNGDVPGIGWLLASTANPTVTGNEFGDNTTPFLMRGSDISAADMPTVSEIQTFLADNGNADTTYAYVVTPGGDLELASRNFGSGPFFSFAVTNTIDTLELALESPGSNNVFSGQETYLQPGDTVFIQSGPSALSSQIDVNNLKVEPDADSANLTLTLATTLPDGEATPQPVTELTLLDYAPGQGANVTVIGNNLGDTIIGNSGNDTIIGGTGNDTYEFTASQLANGQTITGGGGSDTLLITDPTTPVTILDSELVDILDVQTLQVVTSGGSTITLGADASADGLLTLNAAQASGSLTLDASAMTTSLTIELSTDGNDTLTGPTSAAAIYEFGAPPSAGNDTITNFKSGTDEIVVTAATFGGGLIAGNDASSVFEASNNNTFASTADRFHFDTATGGLYFSANGTTASEVLLATVTNGATINGHDIHVV